MNIVIVGCGYVAEFYGATLSNYPQLKLVGAFDVDAARLAAFVNRYPCHAYRSLEDVLSDSNVALIVNLTNPRSHYALNRAALEAGKHVYSEKPLAMTTADAQALVALADSRGLSIGAAPCSVLSETAQTLAKAVRDGVIGQVRLAYANFDDGMIAPKQSPWKWTNESGVPWPAKDEFEIGCTYQHAGYVLTWLGAMFGPAMRVSSFASCLLRDKGVAVDSMAPDFTTAGIEYQGGVAARVTCGLVAPRDKSITIVGDDGVLFVNTVRNDTAPVMVRTDSRTRWEMFLSGRTKWLQRWLDDRLPGAAIEMLHSRRLPLVRGAAGAMARPDKPVDFCRGIAEAADAIAKARSSRLSGPFAAHILEITERLQYPERFEGSSRMATTFAPIEPMPWAR